MSQQGSTPKGSQEPLTRTFCTRVCSTTKGQPMVCCTTPLVPGCYSEMH